MTFAAAPPDITAYREELRLYHVRLAEWLGLDPSKVFLIADADVEPSGRADPLAMPLGTDVTWGAIEKQTADEHQGRHPLPWEVRGDVGGTVYADGVHLDWSEARRLRAEVGERPEFPEP